MANIADFLENIVLDELFGRTAWPSKPASFYFALATTAPTDSVEGTEVSAGGYARVAVACTSGGFAVAGGITALGAVTNVAAISFPTATAAWGTVPYFMIFDAASGGNMLFWGALAAPKTPGIGDKPTIEIGDFSFTWGGNMGALAAHGLNLYIFNGTSLITTITGIATLYMRLGTSSAVDSLAGEPAHAGVGYIPDAITNDAARFAAASSGQKVNNAEITFTAASGALWGTKTAFMITDSVGTVNTCTGHVIWFGLLDAAVTPASGDSPSFNVGELALHLD